MTAPAEAPPARRVAGEVFRYGVVGICSMAIYAVSSAFLALVVGLWPGLAAGIAVILSSLFNYIGHARFTFRSSSPVTSSFPRYVLLLAFNAGLAALVVGLSMDWLGFSLAIANGIALVVVTGTSFVLMKHVVMAARRAT